MVQIRENWTDIRGELLDARQSSVRTGFVELEILVTDAAPVPGFVDFLQDRVGTVVIVNVPADAVDLGKLAKGARIAVRVRRGQRPDDLFARAGTLTVG